MNLLYKDNNPTKYIWIAPERTGTRATNLYFKDNGYISKIIGNSIAQSNSESYTHNLIIPPTYVNDNYALICNVRNPYFRVLSIWKSIHIYNELSKMDPIDKEDNKNITTNVIFSNFFNSDKKEINCKYKLQGCVCKDFYSFVYEHNKWISLPDIKSNLFSFKETYFLRMESLVDDILKLPLTKNSQHYIVKNDYTSKQDKIYILKFHFLRSIIINGDLDIAYYKKVIEKTFIDKKLESSLIHSFYKKLCTIDVVEKKEYVEYVKSFFEIADKRYFNKLIDLNVIFCNENFYDERTSSIVHYLNKDWFEKFNYSKDSWK